MVGLCYEAAKAALEAYDKTPEWGDHFIIRDNIVAIAGSDDPLDWWRNLYVHRVKGLHQGFYHAARALQSSFKYLPKNPVFTGHSRGGAIAVILAQLYNSQAITFGAPKSGSKHPHIAFVAAGDIVPCLPLSYARQSVLYIDGREVIKDPSRVKVAWNVLTRRGIQHRMSHYRKLIYEIDTLSLQKALDGSFPPW